MVTFDRRQFWVQIVDQLGRGFPAHAGIDPPTPRAWVACARLPHTRGLDPATCYDIGERSLQPVFFNVISPEFVSCCTCFSAGHGAAAASFMRERVGGPAARASLAANTRRPRSSRFEPSACHRR